MSDLYPDRRPEPAPEPAPELADVPFADGETDVLPHAWASRGLRWLHDNRSNVFMDMMREGVFGFAPATSTPRGRPPKGSA